MPRKTSKAKANASKDRDWREQGNPNAVDKVGTAYFGDGGVTAKVITHNGKPYTVQVMIPLELKSKEVKFRKLAKVYTDIRRDWIDAAKELRAKRKAERKAVEEEAERNVA